MRISDTIEAFIKTMLEEEQSEIELKRNELAAYFHCAPSQINYVLSTRFTPDHGYVTSSQRGGGGYIRIVRVRRSSGDLLTYLLKERIGQEISYQESQNLCTQLVENKIISAGDGQLILSALSNQTLSVPIPEQVKDVLRARIFRSMLLSLAQRREPVPRMLPSEC